jgi:MYXO-CTERM domain-containing protein
MAWQPNYWSTPNYWPPPIAGGGTHTGQGSMFAGVATFSVTVTQVGLTASQNGTQYLTVWNKQGTMLGQVDWTPAADAAFVGIDTMGVPIGMVSYGNHDMWNGQCYDIGGLTIISDSWVWAAGFMGPCTMNSQCDDGNPCTDDTCTNGACVHTNNAAPCSTGNPCTAGDTCMGGTCMPGTGMLCAPPDACHLPGTCNPTNGTCTYMNKPDDTSCNDMNACTQMDTCLAGTCVGTNPMMCAPPDSCHMQGTCDPKTGMCNNPTKPDGSPCEDGNACTKNDTCTAGVCQPGTMTTCKAMDACHDVGMCDTMTGMCSNPPKKDGASCDDGDPCTQSDVCTAGACAGTAVVCAPMDECHAAGLCDMGGTCSNPGKPDGTPCTGGTCLSGVCKPSTEGAGGAGTGGSSGAGVNPTPGQKGGCHCAMPGGSGPSTGSAAALLALLALRRRRRRA